MDWDAYAKNYDDLCALNPAYHDNIRVLLDHLANWKLPSDAAICDLGAGTGNYIIRMNEVMPQASYWHVDFDSRMNELARSKYEAKGLTNVSIIQEEIHNVEFPHETFDLVICINALYAFTPQDVVLKNIKSWLKPSGKLFLIDFGRKQSTLDWTFYIFREAVKSHQIGYYAKTLIEGREILKQNRRATKGQQSGRYWLHSTSEFGAALSNAGFTVQELKSVYRDYADLAICSK